MKEKLCTCEQTTSFKFIDGYLVCSQCNLRTKIQGSVVLTSSSINTDKCPHNNIESNMIPDTCRDCGKVLVEPVEDWEKEFDEKYLPWTSEGSSTYSKGIGGNSIYTFPSGGFAKSIKDFILQSHIDLARTIRDDLIAKRTGKYVPKMTMFVKVEDIISYFKDRFNV